MTENRIAGLSGRPGLLSRRAFVFALAGGVVPHRSRAAAIRPTGRLDGAGVAALTSMSGFGEGDRAIHVLVSPGCDKASVFIPMAVREAGVDVRFVPFATIPAFDGMVGGFVSYPSQSALEAFARGDLQVTSIEAGALQREAFESVGKALYFATGRPPAAPTVVVVRPGGGDVFRGAPDLGDFRAIVAYARSRPSAAPWVTDPALFPSRAAVSR